MQQDLACCFANCPVIRRNTPVSDVFSLSLPQNELSPASRTDPGGHWKNKLTGWGFIAKTLELFSWCV